MKTILVTGGTRGIGRAITEKLLEEGHKVYLVYKDSAEQATVLTEKYGDKITVLQANLADSEQIQQAVEQLKDVKLDGIVNNAGIVYLTKWDELNFDEWDETLAVNLTAPVKLVHGLRHNLKDGGTIVNIASVDGFVAAFDTVAYAASKAALISVTKSLAAILGYRGIRVNAIAPGWVETEMTADTMPDESKELTPLKRNAKPEEIANVARFLLSDQSGFVNGTTVTVDGGLTIVDYTLFKESER
ncbi:SDR family oxidoreductase [Candidatus Saccharibacteria bacterium]|nr:SDR family oxidoreductase [Candidatus Saccharibacteria bacterium]